MPNTHEILTDLVVEALKISQPERDPISFYIGKKTQTAIANAAEQIKQQERERGEKLENAIKNTMPLFLSVGSHRTTLMRVKERLEAALVELEAE